MKEYLLFDADGTLYDFGKTEKIALSALFNELGIPENLLPVYHEENRKCWDMYEKGEITLEELEPLRFQLFFDRIGNNADSTEAGNEYARLLGENGILIDGAREFLDEVRERYHLEIITNGIARVQKARFKGTDTLHYFENIFISQEIGYAKPDPRFFSHVLSDLDTAPENCLVIGDSDSSDIKGAINSGIDSVFISFTGKTSSLADHSVSSYQELLSLLDDFN